MRNCACTVIACALLLPAALPQTPGVVVSADVVLERARQYVREFESAFALVIGDETYEQRIQINQGSSSPPVVNRRIAGELLFMWVPEDHTWLSVRNILSVNGQRVAGSDQRLEDALKQPLSERETRLQRLAELSARFNVGSIYRNFNNPTLALQFLDGSYERRFRFVVRDARPERNTAGTPIRSVDFAETQRPTIIRDSGQDHPVTGSILVRVADGVVVKSVLRLAGRGTTPDVSITVDYGRDPRLDLWVPLRMEEVYQTVVIGGNTASTMRDQTKFNRIQAVATYANFRRFETSGRIIPPK